MVTSKSDEVLEFWFGDALTSPDEVGPRVRLWFGQNPEFDSEIKRRFGSLPEKASRGELAAWRGEARAALALVLALDQFPRNLYRRSARAFAFDSLARDVALEMISRGVDKTLHPLHASFLYLPLEHAEDMGLQDRSVQLFTELAARAPAALRPWIEQFAVYARRHRDVIHRFGRFPHRNRVLDRKSSAEEVAYLESGGETFGAA